MYVTNSALCVLPLPLGAKFQLALFDFNFFSSNLYNLFLQANLVCCVLVFVVRRLQDSDGSSYAAVATVRRALLFAVELFYFYD